LFSTRAFRFINRALKTELKPAVFLDRDGTLIHEKDHLHHVEDVWIFAGAAETLRQLMDAGFLLFIITNQSGVGRGYFTMEDMNSVHRHISAELAVAGARFEKFYVAPELPGQPSRGRKPLPQFLFDARDEFGLDLARSYMVGDKLIDLQCGWNAGVKKSILVRTGYGATLEKESPEKLTEALIVTDVVAAGRWILADAR
jgi:D-glycero-D-manno-heptose 1,7-bisphosphate phosphatase